MENLIIPCKRIKISEVVERYECGLILKAGCELYDINWIYSLLLNNTTTTLLDIAITTNHKEVAFKLNLCSPTKYSYVRNNIYFKGEDFQAGALKSVSCLTFPVEL